MQITQEQVKPTDQDFANLLFAKEVAFIQLQKYAKILEQQIAESELKIIASEKKVQELTPKE